MAKAEVDFVERLKSAAIERIAQERFEAAERASRIKEVTKLQRQLDKLSSSGAKSKGGVRTLDRKETMRAKLKAKLAAKDPHAPKHLPWKDLPLLVDKRCGHASNYPGLKGTYFPCSSTLSTHTVDDNVIVTSWHRDTDEALCGLKRVTRTCGEHGCTHDICTQRHTDWTLEYNRSVEGTEGRNRCWYGMNEVYHACRSERIDGAEQMISPIDLQWYCGSLYDDDVEPSNMFVEADVEANALITKAIAKRAVEKKATAEAEEAKAEAAALRKTEKNRVKRQRKRERARKAKEVERIAALPEARVTSDAAVHCARTAADAAHTTAVAATAHVARMARRWNVVTSADAAAACAAECARASRRSFVESQHSVRVAIIAREHADRARDNALLLAHACAAAAVAAARDATRAVRWEQHRREEIERRRLIMHAAEEEEAHRAREAVAAAAAEEEEAHRAREAAAAAVAIEASREEAAGWLPPGVVPRRERERDTTMYAAEVCEDDLFKLLMGESISHDDADEEDSEEDLEEEKDLFAPPPEFECPIANELMRDPVVAADGETYERAAIEEWFGRGKTTSPLTNEELRTTDLFQNKTMWRMIVAWKEKNGL